MAREWIADGVLVQEIGTRQYVAEGVIIQETIVEETVNSLIPIFVNHYCMQGVM